MRVAQVSAHYPPNFVSGGTLVPRRIARALAAAGHEAHVYAGHLDDSRRALSTWDDTDTGEHGTVRVRWIETHPYTSWSDRKNWANPAVEADFRGWLEQVRPDVVHLHSLQTLGGSLVRAAKESGAAVVVTAHDWWWQCTRQFLVDRDLRPCSLVVGCGVCRCERGRDDADARLAALAPELAHADVVLAPSASAAATFLANGVAPELLEVDENGLPGVGEGVGAGDPAPEPRTGDGPLRLLFAGGNDAVKGGPLLLSAARRLAAEDPGAGWTLDMYGTRADADAGGPVPPQIRLRPPFAPEDRAGVLAGADVLVLPSIMRESHSILTREALGAGLAVLATDTLGPEEAVAEDVNGWIVPAGDEDTLLARLRGLVADPARARARTGQGSASPVLALSDQVDGLIARYAAMCGKPAGTAEAASPGVSPASPGEEAHVPDDEPHARGPRTALSATADSGARDAEHALMRRVLFVSGIQGAPQRYRTQLAAEALGLHGVSARVRHYRDPRLIEEARRCDALVLYRVPATDQIVDLVAQVRARPRAVPVLFDIDDLIFDPALEGQVDGLEGMPADELALWWRGVRRYRTSMELADAYVGSTQTLCEHATAVTTMPSYRFPNGVGTLLARRSDRALRRERTEGPVRIGYFSGTTTHDADWAMVEPAVIDILERHPSVELWLGGHLRPTGALAAHAERVRRLPFVPWYDLPGLLRDVDVSLAPLTPGSIFNEAKSAIKWLESALVETPVVASPTQPFRESVTDGITGFLPGDVDGWTAALDALVTDPALRRRIGARARREALLAWSPHVQGRTYLDLLVDAAARVRSDGPRESVGWKPVTDDEPFDAAGAHVEPYALPRSGLRVPAALAGSRAVRLLGSARRVQRDAGTREVLRRGVGKVRGRLGR
ncbi:glycosyltransferase [Georgenia sp. Z1491]|uniref:glycosyltransferase n=1 Tax=Georgenia sp. Z1491 TaxID=3416707 RepID=UPI003CEFFF37